MKSLKGITAMKGKVKGPVHLITDPGAMVVAKKGIILVAPYTTPLMTLAISEAVGLVTDFGGITSHAAIVAREFGIPCVVNTKDATKVLKQGQTITIDADTGVVFYDDKS